LGEEGVGMQKQKDKEESQPEPNKPCETFLKLNLDEASLSYNLFKSLYCDRTPH
jgi:hypothetical protein